MTEFTWLTTTPIPDQPSPESERLLKRAAIMRRGLEKARSSGPSLWFNRLLTAAFALRARPPRGTNATWRRYDNDVRARLVTAPNPDPANGVLMWIHGGGFISGNPRLEQLLAAGYAAAAQIPAFLPRYRLAPKYRFPAAADDVLAAYECLLRQGYPADRIRLGGLSAGGALAVGLLGDIDRAGLPMPAAVLLVSPVLQLSAESAQQRDAVQRDPFCSPDFIERTSKLYAGDTPLTDPRLNYLTADMRAGHQCWCRSVAPNASCRRPSYWVLPCGPRAPAVRSRSGLGRCMPSRCSAHESCPKPKPPLTTVANSCYSAMIGEHGHSVSSPGGRSVGNMIRLIR